MNIQPSPRATIAPRETPTPTPAFAPELRPPEDPVAVEETPAFEVGAAGLDKIVVEVKDDADVDVVGDAAERTRKPGLDKSAVVGS
jgi:hypothetical protein